MYSNLRWIGGKKYQASWLHTLQPQASKIDCIVDVFGGAAWWLLSQPLGKAEVFNDLCSEVNNYWTVVRDNKDALIEMAEQTPVSRELCEHLETLSFADPVKRAWRFFCLNRQTFSGTGTDGDKVSWSISTRLRRGIAETASSWISAVSAIDALSTRLRSVILESLDFADVIAKYDRPGVLFYCDPPYDLGTIVNTYYGIKFTREDHVRLYEALKGIQGLFMVSGFNTPLYEGLFLECDKQEKPYKTAASTSEIKASKIEVVWRNFRE